MSLSDKVIGLAQAIGQDVKVLTEQVEALVPVTLTRLDISGGNALQLVDDSNYQMYLNFGSNAAGDL